MLSLIHILSSNYPSATYSYESTSWWSGEYIWNFGDRAKGSDGKDATFYKSATNADELKHVFDDISKEISKGSGYPTKTSEGFEPVSYTHLIRRRSCSASSHT